MQTTNQLNDQLLRLAQHIAGIDTAILESWKSRIDLCYGAMDGQRAVTFAGLEQVDAHSAVIAMESLFFLQTNLIALSAFHRTPDAFLREVSGLTNERLRHFLVELEDGTLFKNLGVSGFGSGCKFDWLFDASSSLCDLLKEIIVSVSLRWDEHNLLLEGDDPFQALQHQLFPANLCHVTGQFFTPEWLAELLLLDAGWNPSQTLVDPFCGSGVFIVKALRQAVDNQASIDEILPRILGVELNPITAAACRANIALFLAQHASEAKYCINILAADSVLPSALDADRANCLWAAPLAVDGITTTFESPYDDIALYSAHAYANAAGLNLSHWISPPTSHGNTSGQLAALTRREADQILTCNILPADVLVTNPPWVGWEYMSRPYREITAPAWKRYDLFNSKGLEASFLKEDLSNLAIVTAWDRYLRLGGSSAVVIRPSTMHSEVASSTVRRLTITDGGIPLKLKSIRTFPGISVFESAKTNTAAWILEKGEPTEFPVAVLEMQKRDRRRWSPESSSSLLEVRSKTTEIDRLAKPTTADSKSRWMIASREDMTAMKRLAGENELQPRMGVFTGGANAVFYMQELEQLNGLSLCENIVERAKRKVEQVQVKLETDSLRPVVRGRDLKMWEYSSEVGLLFPHDQSTGMYPLDEQELSSRYPQAHKYLRSMKKVLSNRKGFAGWEKNLLNKYFYTLQRVGPYTFAPYKVCWRYIASEFIVCVVDTSDDGRLAIPNDKVMFVPFESRDEAFFVAGVLSASLARRYVNSLIESRQISTKVIKTLQVPVFDKAQEAHCNISRLCREGHEILRESSSACVAGLREAVDELVEQLYE
ncbi:N-6 DNA Methylase [Thalassoglobus polymorphus]|uniref:N-6 DNA Methylase n=1 Tax=Thalassoglobus polymorphus TaxID=2527994 RepID=A0A517QQY2_9PLAN|nr:N-6 DNA Methylase [Thalassoglobus polymorphus]